jgi:hypothetical protein
MSITARTQQRYDHRLRNLVQRSGDVTVATALGVPRSTARGWLRAAPTVVVCLDVADLTEPELRQEVLKLRRRVRKLTALLQLALALLHTSGFRLTERDCRTDATSGESCGAISTDILHFPARVYMKRLVKYPLALDGASFFSGHTSSERALPLQPAKGVRARTD